MCVPCRAVPRYDTHHGNGAANGRSHPTRTLLKYGGRHNGVILHLCADSPPFFVIHPTVAKVLVVQRYIYIYI